MNKTIVASLIAIVGILLTWRTRLKDLRLRFRLLWRSFTTFSCTRVYSIISHFFGAEFDTFLVTALLTTMSFSVHDTIIIFDKVCEYKRTIGHGDVADYANRALTETLIRTVNNSMTISLWLLALGLLGGSSIKFFVPPC